LRGARERIRKGELKDRRSNLTDYFVAEGSVWQDQVQPQAFDL
jgi:hypothetical protein